MKSVCMIFVFIAICGACDPYSRLPLKITPTEQASQYFRIDGVYYDTKPRLDYTDKIRKKTYFIVFYANGNVFGDFYIVGGVEELKILLLDKEFLIGQQDIVFNWGGFEVNEGTFLNVETWYSWDNWGKYRTKNDSLKVLNDTTLLMLDHKYVDTLHFMPLTYKPDSIPPFVKRGE